jgi:eukaryotic-like serine/threonine-protein kinase
MRRPTYRPTARVCFIALGALCGGLIFQFLVMPLFVRQGAETEVPDLSGLPATQVEQRLEQHGLRMGQTNRAYDDRIEAGCVVRQHPPAGFRVKRGRAVDLLVSLGREALRVPAIEGENMTHARFMLQGEGLTVGRVSGVESAEIQKECVVAANPAPQTRLAGRTAVDLLVSEGPRPARYIMPDVRGCDAGAVERLLASVGLRVSRRSASDRRAHAGSIHEQTPAAGSPVEPGDEVELAVVR